LSLETASVVFVLGERKQNQIAAIAEGGLKTNELNLKEGLQEIDQQPVCRTWYFV
jgi:hypothetical protein